MSETGATGVTDEQIRAAAEQFPLWRIANTDDKLELEYQLRRWLQYLIPPGYQIVPAGAVVLSEEEAAAASYACSIAAEAAYSDEDADERRALAAKLGGGE